jgi:UDP-glucose:(heptosyl)LPS alpha-1,3-glucosyltransferase
MRIDARMIERGAGRVFMPVSGLQQEIFQQEYGCLPGTWKVVHPGVDVARYSPERLAPLRAPARREFGFHDDERVVLFVGMNWETKGLEMLVRALGVARNQPVGAGLRLLVVGKGDVGHYSAIAQSAGCVDAVTFAGVHTAGVERFFAMADLFAMPAEFETFSMVALEAMVAGLPVVVSDRMGVRDLAEIHETVIRAPFATEALSAKILERLEKAPDHVERAERSRRFAHLHWGACAGAVMVQYDEFLKRSGRATSFK